MTTEYIAGPLPLLHWTRIQTRLARLYVQKHGHLSRDLTREHVSVDSGVQHLHRRESLREAAKNALIDLETILSIQLQLSIELDNAYVTSDIRVLELELAMQRQLAGILAEHVEDLPARSDSESRLRAAIEQYAGLRAGSTEAVLQERHLLRQVQHDIPVLGAEDVDVFVQRLSAVRQQVDELEVALQQRMVETQLEFSIPEIYAQVLSELGAPLTARQATQMPSAAHSQESQQGAQDIAGLPPAPPATADAPAAS